MLHAVGCVDMLREHVATVCLLYYFFFNVKAILIGRVLLDLSQQSIICPPPPIESMVLL